MESYSSYGHILVVDDDEVFRSRLARAISMRGYMVTEASDGEKALRIIESGCLPDRAIVDLKMPGSISGLELVYKLRKRHSALKIVVLTGFGTIFSAVEAMKLGATYYLTKPVDTDTILDAFQKTPEALIDLKERIPTVEQVEWEHIQRVLRECNGNISKAARLLKMHRRTLQRKLSKGPILR
ncbi:MAG: response regulator [Candidatus Dadabacteria bacterium]|nr:MAG: response regulator [Candidatus Dadabacteria bacterium]